MSRGSKIHTAARRVAAGLFLPVLILALACVLAAPAQAARVHSLLLSETLPEERTPFALAVNNASHHFYVVTGNENGGERRVYDFESTGQLDPLKPQLTGAPSLQARRVAVDNSGGVFADYIYASNNSDNIVQQFDPEGEATAVVITGSTIPANGTPQSGGLPPVANPGEFRPTALAVDGSGDLFVVDERAKAIDVFSSTGAFLRQLNPGNISNAVRAIAIDAAGDIYLAAESADELPQGLIELDPSGDCVELGCTPVDPAPIQGVAIDGLRGAIYTTASLGPEEGKFSEYDATTGALLGVTRTPQLHRPNGIGIIEDSGEVIVADEKPDREGTFQIYGPVEIVPDVLSLPPSDIASQGATLNGEIGAAGLTGATCVFQYVTEEEFEAHGFKGTPGDPAPTVPCTPAGPFSGEAMNSVHAEISGLKGGTTYHERILGTNENGSNPGEDVPFETTGPTITAGEVADVSETAATLKGTVDPNGAPTTYRFQYLTEADFEASGWSGAIEVPAGGEAIGAGDAPVPLSQPLAGLAPGTAYRFRIVAESPGGESIGEEVHFSTYAPPTTGLPDNRGYEQASPVAKNGANVQGAINAVQASLGGDRVTFFTNTGIPGGEGSQQFPTYLASRAPDGSGWSTQGLLPPASYGPRATVLGWDEGLEDTYDFATPAFEPGSLLRRSSAGGSLIQAGTIASAVNPLAFAGASTGGAVALLQSTAGGLRPDDREGVQNVYAYDRVANHLVVAGAMNDGSVPAEGAMAGPYDWFGSESTTAPGGAFNRYYTQNAHSISTDGSKVFFTAGGTGQLYVRVNPFGEAQELSPAACRATANTKACTIRISAPEEAVTDPETPAAFLGASADGNVVYFLDKGKLTADATGGAGYDLYRYEVDTGELTDLTLDTADKKGAQVEGVLGMGEDGEDLYFVAAGALAPDAIQAPNGETNLYELHEDTVQTIGRLDTGGVTEAKLNWIPTSALSGGLTTNTSRVSADGRTLLLRSTNQLTPYRNAGLAELYLYRAGQGVSCVSCDPTGQAPTGPAGVQQIPSVGINLGRFYAFMTRNLSADGRRVLFDSPDRLVAADRNEVNDVYQWEEPGKGDCSASSDSYAPASGGCLRLISGGAEGAQPSWFGDADSEGENVFFFTSQRLVAQDKDELVDVYDARVGGGIAAQEAEPQVPCEGEAGCRGEPKPPPASSLPTTPTFFGKGNVKPKSKKPCRHGKVRRHGKCVRKHSKRHAKRNKHHRKARHKAKNRRAANHNKGGGR